MKKIIVQKWEESEEGWGTRPDGFSLHVSTESLYAFIKAYWDGMPNETPKEYSRPDGEPYEAEIDDETHEKVRRTSQNGIRVWGEALPGSGGTNGWVPDEMGGMGKI